MSAVIKNTFDTALQVMLDAGSAEKQARKTVQRIIDLDPYEDKRMTVTMAKWLANGIVTDPEEHSGDIVRYKKLRTNLKSLRVKTGSKEHSRWKLLCKFDPRDKTPHQLGDWIRLATELISEPNEEHGIVIACHQDGGDVFHMARMDYESQHVLAPFNRLSYCVANSYFGGYGGPPYFFVFKQKGGQGPLQQYAAILPKFSGNSSQALRNSDNSGRLSQREQQRILPLISIAFENAQFKAPAQSESDMPLIDDPLERLMTGSHTPDDESWLRENANDIIIEDLANVFAVGNTTLCEIVIRSIHSVSDAMKIVMKANSRIRELEPLIMLDRSATKRYMKRFGPPDGVFDVWPHDYVAWAMSRTKERLPRKLEAMAGKVTPSVVLRYIKQWPQATPLVISDNNIRKVMEFLQKNPGHLSANEINKHLKRFCVVHPVRKSRNIRSFRKVLASGRESYGLSSTSDQDNKLIFDNLSTFLKEAHVTSLIPIMSSSRMMDASHEQLDLLLEKLSSLDNTADFLNINLSLYENVAVAALRTGHKGCADLIDSRVRYRLNSRVEMPDLRFEMPNIYSVISKETRDKTYATSPDYTEWLVKAFTKNPQSFNLNGKIAKTIQDRPDGKKMVLDAYVACLGGIMIHNAETIVRRIVQNGISPTSIIRAVNATKNYDTRVKNARSIIRLVYDKDAEEIVDLLIDAGCDEELHMHRDVFMRVRPEKTIAELKRSLLEAIADDPLDYEKIEKLSYPGCTNDNDVKKALATATEKFGTTAMKRSRSRMRKVSKRESSGGS